MKSKKISFFNRLEDTSLLDKVGYSAEEYEASYLFEKSNIGLNLEPDDYNSKKYKVIDGKGLWDISKDGLLLSRNIQIKNPGLLFGLLGVTDVNSILGIAVVCTSTQSDRLDAFKIHEFDSSCQSVDVHHDIDLNPGKYRGNVTLKTVLYLVINQEEESPFPKQSGTILGTLDAFDLDMFDDRQLFPVYEVSEPDSQLWRAVCNWSDIEDDFFISENVAVVINNKHSMYNHIEYKENNKNLNLGYLAEVMSSAMHVIIEKMKESDESWKKVMSNATFKKGTIAYMAQYMRLTFEWDFTSPESTAESIRKYVYSKVVSE